MKIRKADIYDLEAVTAVEAKSFPPAEAAKKEDFEKRLKIYPEHFWVLEENGIIVSMIDGLTTDEQRLTDELMEDPTLHNKNGRWLMIFGVATDPVYRGKGFAGALMEQVIKENKSEGRRGIVLTCKKELIPFYEKFGFINEGRSLSKHGGAVWYEMRIIFE